MCNLAEEVGFEPTEPFGSTVFKTAAFNRSAIPPYVVRLVALLARCARWRAMIRLLLAMHSLPSDTCRLRLRRLRAANANVYKPLPCADKGYHIMQI